MTPSDLWKKRIEQTPGLVPYLEPIAKKWAKGVALPKRMTLGSEPRDPDLRIALSRLFGEIDYRKGKIIAAIPKPLRDNLTLEALAEQLGIRIIPKNNSKPEVSAILQRLRLTHPQLKPVHQWMAHSPEIDRLLSNNPRYAVTLLGLLKAATYLFDNSTPVTLSKLGSVFLNDSKILRNKKALPYSLLGGMMLQFLELEDYPENRSVALRQFGVISNPATTNAALYGPLALIRNGRPDPWIANRHQRREIVILNSTNLENVEAVQLPDGIGTVITTENAAPFHELTLENHQALVLYTGGYPNAIICRLLDLLHEAGVSCKHWGDSDPNGLLIASLIDRRIKTTLFRCGIEEVLRHANDLIPLKGAPRQLGLSLLKNHPDFKFREELELTLRTDHWLEQESWHPST